MSPTSCSLAPALPASAGYGGGSPHASLSQFHDRESFVAAIGATFGAAGLHPAPASQSVLEPSAGLFRQLLGVMEGEGSGDGDAPQARPGDVSLDLIEGHKSEGTDPGRILVKAERYRNGARRVVVRRVPMDQEPVIVGGVPKRIKRDKSEQERVESSVLRTRKVIRRRCMAFGTDRLLTLTYRENMTDRRRAYADTVRFIARCRQVNLLPDYVAVAEQQKRGAWHVHVACRGYMAVMTLRRIWREIVGEFEGKPNGNIDLSYRHRGQSNPWRIAAYLSKYIGKAVAQADPGERTFWASEWNGREPVAGVVLLPHGFSLTQVMLAVGALLDEKRSQGHVRAVESWEGPRKDGKPPDLLVFWAA